MHGPVVDITEFHLTADLSQNGDGVGVPFRDEIVGFDLCPVFLFQLCTIDDLIPFSFTLPSWLENFSYSNLSVAVHYNEIPIPVDHGLEIDIAEYALMPNR